MGERLINILLGSARTICSRKKLAWKHA